MITAKSCLAIRSGRFNERNAMLKKYFMLLTACLFFTAAWLLFAAEAGALSFSQSTGLVSLKVTPEYKTLSPRFGNDRHYCRSRYKTGLAPLLGQPRRHRRTNLAVVL